MFTLILVLLCSFSQWLELTTTHFQVQNTPSFTSSENAERWTIHSPNPRMLPLKYFWNISPLSILVAVSLSQDTLTPSLDHDFPADLSATAAPTSNARIILSIPSAESSQFLTSQSRAPRNWPCPFPPLAPAATILFFPFQLCPLPWLLQRLPCCLLAASSHCSEVLPTLPHTQIDWWLVSVFLWQHMPFFHYVTGLALLLVWEFLEVKDQACSFQCLAHSKMTTHASTILSTSQTLTHLILMTLYAAAAKSRQSCPTLCDPIDSSPPGSHPWDSPGKNTGVGCHFLLQCMKVKRESEVAQSCPALHDPTDCSLPGSSVHGISLLCPW